MDKIIVAGATGNLGRRITRALLQQGADVVALVRHGSASGKVEALRILGATVAEVDFSRPATVARACSGASCVVSALSGVREVILDAQTSLLDAAVEAGVPRFIPSDYCIDFTRLPPGSNRNLDWRREFKLPGRWRRAGRHLHPQRRIHRNAHRPGADHSLQVEPGSGRLLGRRRSAHGLHHDGRHRGFHRRPPTRFVGAQVAPHRRGANQRPRTGVALPVTRPVNPFVSSAPEASDGCQAVITVARAVFPARTVLYPPWQGMQYLHDMFSGLAVSRPARQ